MGKVHELLARMDDGYRKFRAVNTEIRKIHDPRRVNILSKVNLSEEQKKKIDALYTKNYGKKIPYDWHRLYMSYTGRFDEKYIPEMLFIPLIQEKFLSRSVIETLSDKNLLPVLISGINGTKTPRVYVSCTNGVYRDSEMRLITKEKAVDQLQDVGGCFIKPTVDSNSGKGCRRLDFHGGMDANSGKTVEELLNIYGANFNVQELLVNCNSIRNLHPNSVNTFRVTSYIWDNQVCFFPLLLRIGRGENELDNAHQGGMFVGVDPKGNLYPCAYSEFQERFTIHPDSKVEFATYNIPEVPGIYGVIEQLHSRIPQVGMASWDVTIDEQGNIVIVEMNLDGQSVWMTQMANGVGAFGENTEAVLRWISSKSERLQFH